jgi:hypothetical protein
MDHNEDRHDNDDDDFYPTQEEIDAVIMERTVFGQEQTNAELTYRTFEENGPYAAMEITRLARHATSERIRLEASKYVVERLLGRVGDDTAANHTTRIPEAIGEKVGTAIQGMLDDLHLTPEQQALVEEVVPRHLLALEAGQK